MSVDLVMVWHSHGAWFICACTRPQLTYWDIGEAAMKELRDLIASTLALPEKKDCSLLKKFRITSLYLWQKKQFFSCQTITDGSGGKKSHQVELTIPQWMSIDLVIGNIVASLILVCHDRFWSQKQDLCPSTEEGCHLWHSKACHF